MTIASKIYKNKSVFLVSCKFSKFVISDLIFVLGGWVEPEFKEIDPPIPLGVIKMGFLALVNYFQK